MRFTGNQRELYQTAFAAGVLGAFGILSLRAIAEFLRLTELNLGFIIGTAFTIDLNGLVAVGFPIELFLFSVFSLVYAAAFIQFGRASLKLGALGGAIQWLICGLVLGLIARVHPLMPRTVSDPGFFGKNAGIFEVIFFFLLNVSYGALVGYFCEPVIRRSKIREEMKTDRAA